MLFAEGARYQYTRSPLIEVICQLRFPTILSIGAKDPADFQEAIRHEFPRYAARQELPPPTVSGAGTASPKVEQPPAITNHNFISADGLWKLNLTKDFIALSTLRYTRWEDFAARLDKPLAQFIQFYEPSFFERIGLRYVNAVSRKNLGLEDSLWDDLIQPMHLGVLCEPDVDETTVTKSSVDTELTLTDGCHFKCHAGPGLLNGGKQDQEIKFILDADYSVAGSMTADKVPGLLQNMHEHADSFFRAAITDELFNALGPVPAEP
ncbi:MAG: TIGR04255 family protein [Clostridia bacterium]|nr:TIGR04255 family protein [Clostridia bacterium]